MMSSQVTRAAAGGQSHEKRDTSQAICFLVGETPTCSVLTLQRCEDFVALRSRPCMISSTPSPSPALTPPLELQ